MKRFHALLLIASLCAGCAASVGERAPAPFASLEWADIGLITASGRHDFGVWIADDELSRANGLMFIKSLPADRGMLFLFEETRYASFWMKNTYVSLDIVFIGADGVVVNIVKNTEPLSQNSIVSEAPVKGALELVAGTADKIGLTAGARVLHPAFEARNSEVQ